MCAGFCHLWLGIYIDTDVSLCSHVTGIVSTPAPQHLPISSSIHSPVAGVVCCFVTAGAVTKCEMDYGILTLRHSAVSRQEAAVGGWTRPPGRCTFHRGSTTSLHYCSNSTGWRSLSRSSSNSLSSCPRSSTTVTDLADELHRSADSVKFDRVFAVHQCLSLPGRWSPCVECPDATCHFCYLTSCFPST